VRERTVLERIDVSLDGRQIDGRFLRCSLRQEHLGVVNPLGTRGDLLSTDEDVVRIGEGRVGRVGHRVEGPHAGGELASKQIGINLWLAPQISEHCP